MDHRVFGPLICFGTPVVVGLLFFLGLYLANFRYNREAIRIENRILAEGRVVKGWLVFANEALYNPSRTEVYNWGQVVFTFDDDRPNLDERLEAIAARVRAFRPLHPRPEDNPENERRLASVMSTLLPDEGRIRLPDRLTGGLAAYTASVAILRRHLPGRRLERPYVMCKALPDAEEGREGQLVMVEYPA
jgi:hypothetical protein